MQKLRQKQSYKNYFIQRFSIIFITLLSVALTTESASAKKYAAIVVDDKTGEILYSRSANLLRHPASITKVMTLYLLFEAIENGKLNMNSRLKVSKRASRATPSKLYLSAGSSIRVRDAIGTLITKSANDVAITVAEALAGTETAFAKKMTEKARKIGMKRTTFRNASGLHHSKQVTTAKDISVLARRMRRDFSKYYKLFRMKSYKYNGHTYRSHNRLLGQYKGMEGMKTGYINASGFNLVAVAKRNNQRVITVVLGGKTGKSRNRQVAKLMDLGFSRLPNLTIVKAPTPANRKAKKRLVMNIPKVSLFRSSQENSPKTLETQPNTPASLAETLETQPNTPASLAETLEIQPNTPASPTKTLETQPNTPASLAETLEIQPNTPASPTKTLEIQPNTPVSPTTPTEIPLEFTITHNQSQNKDTSLSALIPLPFEVVK